MSTANAGELEDVHGAIAVDAGGCAPPVIVDEGSWALYSERRPPAKGVYQWRLPLQRTPGMFVVFLAHMRERGAGYTTAVSPAFDYWDGYQLHVPAGTQWREAPAHKAFQWWNYADIKPEGVALVSCPYCGSEPAWDGIEVGGNYTDTSPDPHRISAWRLKCCAWAATPFYTDPRRLATIRNGVIAGAGSVATLTKATQP